MAIGSAQARGRFLMRAHGVPHDPGKPGGCRENLGLRPYTFKSGGDDCGTEFCPKRSDRRRGRGGCEERLFGRRGRVSGLDGGRDDRVAGRGAQGRGLYPGRQELVGQTRVCRYGFRLHGGGPQGSAGPCLFPGGSGVRSAGGRGIRQGT